MAYNKNKKKFIWGIAFLIFSVFLVMTVPTWKYVKSYTLFSRNGADVYRGRFFSPAEDTQIPWSDGASGNGRARVERDGRTVIEWNSGAGNDFYKILKGDSICPETSERSSQSASCITVENDGWLVNHTGKDPWWSSRVAKHVYPGIYLTTFLRAMSPDDVVFTSLWAPQRTVTVPLHVGLNRINLRSIAHAHVLLIVSSVLFAGLCAGILTWCIVYYKNIWHMLSEVPVFSCLLAVQIAIQYVSVFPGMFASDIIVHDTLMAQFYTWYSSFYIMYQFIIHPFFPLFIQLPQVLLYFSVSVYLAYHLKKLRMGKLWISLYFVVQAFSPVVFSMLFVQQRMFVAAEILFSAFIIVGIRISQKQSVGTLGYVFLLMAALLRPEYWSFLILSIAYDAYINKDKFKVAKSFLNIVIATGIINFLIPAIEGVPINQENEKYKMISALDLLRPYVNCNKSNPDDVAAFDTIGGIEAYCTVKEDYFFWKFVAKVKYPERKVAYDRLNKLLNHDLLNDPRPEIMRTTTRLSELSLWPAWEIYDRYQDKTLDSVYTPWVFTPSIFKFYADAAGMVPDYKWQAPLSSAVTKFYYKISVFIPMGIWLLFCTFCIPLLVRNRIIILINYMIISIIALCAFASPAPKFWSYMILVWIWGMLILPLWALIQKGWLPQKKAQS
ncbi:hypothetical protein [Komagataeibacter xylinus]|uniref:hypothetical protein n=1 Tax=Komagataeibacter xylinus TaxID=28448 RepID=UPI00280B4695|nr:hypothetical protein [Komagataeibacter xylinus]